MERNSSESVFEADEGATDWHRRVVGRSLDGARRRSIDRGARLIRAAATVLERNGGESLTVQEVADEAGQSLRTLYQYFASKDDLLLAVFEEAMGTYARLIRAAVEGLDDPVERLSGALIGSVRMPALHDKHGVDRGLSRLRLQLGQAEPALLARSQEPVTSLFRELVGAALAATPSEHLGIDQGTYFVSTARSSFTLSATLGKDLDLELPDPIDLSVFCLNGLGIQRPRAWHEGVDTRLALGGTDGRSILRRLSRDPKAGRR
ncbi:MAG TPA: TetR/AcrR family transcriptional regulator [Acidimicrobiales bacterium]|nr:TetR/AcrR family transcriptional regulator [Acidimicrobiales bacterium]